ncbi:MAG: LytS/YhcK type 5TM receptor domain-containing protein [Candidatus Competibacteraceae bacterium]
MNAVLIELLDNVALLLALGLLYDMLTPQQKDAQTWPQQLFAGVFLGFISIALMLNPLPFAEGLIFDTRSVLLSVSGLFLGPAPTLIAMVMGALFRLYLGGVGVGMGIAVIAITGGMGLAWRSVRYQWLDSLSIIELYAFGIVVHVAMLCCVGLLPGALARAVLVEVGPPVMLLYPVCTALLGTLMANLRRRRRAAAELHAARPNWKRWWWPRRMPSS